MKRLSEFRLPAWFGPRAYWAFAVLAIAYAASAPLHALWPLALALSAAAALLLIADIAMLPRADALRFVREEPEPFAMRRRGELRYEVQNRAGTTLRTGIVETPSAMLEYASDEIRTSVPSHAAVTLARTVLPLARGRCELDALYVWYESSIGFVRRRLRVPQISEVRVYPDLSAVERYGTLHARNRLIESGLRRMRLRGTGTEFESVREWTAGDAFRSIDWKSTARAGKVMVAQHEIERSQNVMIVLDAGRLMMARSGDQRKFDYAITAALSVAAVAALANDKVGFVAFAREILRARAPSTAGRGLDKLASQLYDVEPRFEESDYDGAFAYVRSHLSKRTLIVFFTDVIDPVAQSAVLAQLRTLSRRHVVMCAFMNDAAIDKTLDLETEDVATAYAQSVALELRSERKRAATLLERLGVRVIDVPAADLTTALIDRYLAIKQRGEL